MVDKKFITNIKGKEFITHEGLLAEFHKNGGKEISAKIVKFDMEKGLVVFRARVSGERGTFIGHGDAHDGNVSDMIKPHKIRMAETRAINRALRFYNNIGMCSREELE